MIPVKEFLFRNHLDNERNHVDNENLDNESSTVRETRGWYQAIVCVCVSLCV